MIAWNCWSASGGSGQIEPEIGGVFRYRGWDCCGEAVTLEDAKAVVEASIPSANPNAKPLI